MPKGFYKARDPISCYTHFLGAVLSVIGLIIMSVSMLSSSDSGILTIISCILFCLSLIALYSASAVYHYSTGSDQILLTLRKLDHAMIYVLIAGSYTPILLNLFPRPGGIYFTIAIWTAALLGIIFKLCWINAPRWLGTTLYLLMGWAVVADLPALAALPVSGILLLVLGGVSYSIGGAIYICKRPNFSPAFGFHELFHIFVMLGSAFHYLLVLRYIAI